MAWRGIHLTRAAYLSVENRALKISFRDDAGGLFRISLEDLAYLIIDSAQVSLSSSLLAALSESAVLVIGSNERHLPVWTSLPWAGFHRHGEVISLQLKASLPTRKQLWSHIVTTKVLMQAACLEFLGRDGSDSLQAMASQVRSGDPGNVEARAARLYWQNLFPERTFRRHEEDLPNAMLNYGYAIVRSVIARQLCAMGFIPQIGIHHCNQTNAFNLADDLIEPYRPYVDRLVIDVLGETPSSTEFSVDFRRKMLNIMETIVQIGEASYGFLPAIEVTVMSLKTALATRDPRQLVYPVFRQP
jgi:CRISPR-associated protein Cas1